MNHDSTLGKSPSRICALGMWGICCIAQFPARFSEIEPYRRGLVVPGRAGEDILPGHGRVSWAVPVSGDASKCSDSAIGGLDAMLELEVHTSAATLRTLRNVLLWAARYACALHMGPKPSSGVAEQQRRSLGRMPGPKASRWGRNSACDLHRKVRKTRA
jgi:hypothetical protein